VVFSIVRPWDWFISVPSESEQNKNLNSLTVHLAPVEEGEKLDFLIPRVLLTAYTKRMSSAERKALRYTFDSRREWCCFVNHRISPTSCESTGKP
jgi:hypothetical protein